MDETQERETRRRRKRKLRKGRLFFTLLVVFVLVIGVYSYVQYKKGYQLANGEQQAAAEFKSSEPSSGERENILVLGADSAGNAQSRTDTMMLVSWDKKENDVKIVSFMRDIYADIPGYKSYKLNTAYYLGGVQLLTDTIQNMFDVPIHHYALIDFRSFESLVDIIAPEGVPIDVEKDMSEKIGVALTKGKHDLNGKELLGYARFRADAEGDFGRVHRQQIVMEALKDEILSVSSLPKLPKFVGAAEGYIETDYSKGEKAKRVIDAITSGKIEIEKLTVPIENSYSFGSYSHAGSVIEINTEKNRAAISDFLEKK